MSILAVNAGSSSLKFAIFDDGVRKVKMAIARLCEVARLHNPPALKAIEAAEASLPGVPQMAVFDTAFYAKLPPKSYLYPVPYECCQQWGIRPFGFHGISHAYCAIAITMCYQPAPARNRAKHARQFAKGVQQPGGVAMKVKA